MEIKRHFDKQKANSKFRGIEFALTFEQWWDIWQQSGKWDQRGCKKGQYVMSRVGDVGPYAVGNVFIQQHKQNSIDANFGRKHRPRTQEWREKQRQVRLGKNKSPKEIVICPHCHKTGGKPVMIRWHNDNCKEKVYV
jgi:hypothetical protein